MNGLEVQLQAIASPKYKLDPGRVLPQSGRSLQKNHHITICKWTTVMRVFLFSMFFSLFSYDLSTMQAYAQTDKAAVTTTQENNDEPIYIFHFYIQH